MPNFVSFYTEPGVYVKIQDVSLPAVPSGIINVAMFGHGKLTKTVIREEVTRASSDPGGCDDLANTNENVISVSSQIYDEYGNIYFENDDYVLDTGIVGEETDYAEICWTPVYGNEPDGGVKYYVTYVIYKTEAAGDFDVKVIESPDQGYDYYGDEMATNGDGDSQTLSVGIRVALENGASQVTAVQINEDDSDPIQSALDKLKLYDVQIIVPCLPTSSTVNTTLVTDVYNHCRLMSTMLERKFRIGLIGVDKAVDDTSDFAGTKTEYTSLAAVASNRIGIIGPSKSTITYDDVDYDIGSWGLTAAIAGIISEPSTNVGEPVSGKILAGFTEIYDLFTRVQKNEICSNGITWVEEDGTVDRVRHFLSTDMTSAVTQELKVTLIADFVARIIIQGLRAAFVNTRNIGEETLSNIKAALKLMLDVQIDQEILTEYDNIDISRNDSEPRQIDIRFSLYPVFDIGWIYVEMGVTF